MHADVLYYKDTLDIMYVPVSKYIEYSGDVVVWRAATWTLLLKL